MNQIIAVNYDSVSASLKHNTALLFSAKVHWVSFGKYFSIMFILVNSASKRDEKYQTNALNNLNSSHSRVRHGCRCLLSS